jgi:hypothetical protein
VFWKVNARKLYYVPVATLDEKVRTAVEKLPEGFAQDTEDAAGELPDLELQCGTTTS